MDLNSSTSAGALLEQRQPYNWPVAAAMAIVLTGLVSLYLGAVAQIYKKNRFGLEPLHIFELNTLANIILVFVCQAFELVNIWKICPLINWLKYYARLNFTIGIVMSQVDRSDVVQGNIEADVLLLRFVALYWHASYKDRVTPMLAQGSRKIMRLFSLVSSGLKLFLLENCHFN